MKTWWGFSKEQWEEWVIPFFDNNDDSDMLPIVRWLRKPDRTETQAHWDARKERRLFRDACQVSTARERKRL